MDTGVSAVSLVRKHSAEETDMNPTDVLSSIQELATRTVDGLHVRLLWSAVERRAWVSVIDVTRDQTVSVPVGEHQNALEVFHHPFAYAA
jgi:hypothetical protein